MFSEQIPGVTIVEVHPLEYRVKKLEERVAVLTRILLAVKTEQLDIWNAKVSESDKRYLEEA